MKKNISKILIYSLLLFSISSFAQNTEKMTTGRFEPTWESLAQYEIPEWFRNAKFGIWAHWGPQCVPEQGAWYARDMYIEGHPDYEWHVRNYGHPSEFGFKDICNMWKVENWNPDALVKFYKEAGARYFFAMANHHDNMDLWNSTYQPWNSVNIGPKRGIIEEWTKAVRKHNLYYGISIHSAHAWSWYETSQLADKSGPKAGIPYDGNMTKDEGLGKWWEGLDPQCLYSQNHPLSKDSDDPSVIHKQWNWGEGASIPSQDYCNNFYNRNIEIINKFKPDMLYYDDTALPLWPISDVGLRVAAHYYNTIIKEGKPHGVIFGKILTEEQKKAIVWDVERGIPDDIQALPWQTCTCIGEWHYNRSVYEKDKYKPADHIIRMLIDIVSKNGNLLLSIPMKADGSIDEKEIKITKEIGKWIKINGKGIYDTRPWKIFGEGPSVKHSNPLNAQGFNEGNIHFTEEDIRFTAKGKTVFAFTMGKPQNKQVTIKSFYSGNPYHRESVRKVVLLGYGKVDFIQNKDGLIIQLPELFKTTDYLLTFQIN